jgi:hypothetical protein
MNFTESSITESIYNFSVFSLRKGDKICARSTMLLSRFVAVAVALKVCVVGIRVYIIVVGSTSTHPFIGSNRSINNTDTDVQ